MTTVGISYLQYKEGVRSNLRNEQLKELDLQEQKRRNLAVELENNRHNLAVEGLQRRTLDETIRSNLAKELEINRSNLVREGETNRSNLAREAQAAYDTHIKFIDEFSQSQLAGEALGLDPKDTNAAGAYRLAGGILDKFNGILKLATSK